MQQTAANPEALLDDAAKRVQTSKRWLWLFVLPGCFAVLYALFVHAHGPFYLSHNLDPDYAYLGNSLNVLRLNSPHHVDHPGTTLQVFGAVVLKLTHPFTGNRRIVRHVFQNPERHLQVISLVLAGTYFSGLVLTGILLWRKTGRLLPALTLQATPFILGEHVRVLARVTPETMLLIIGVLMAAVLYINSFESTRKGATPLALGILSALGTITKMSFAPLAIMPLAGFERRRERGMYLASAAAMGLIWLIPLAERKDRLVQWAVGLATRQGRHGTGQSGLLPAEYLTNLFRLMTENPFLTGAIVIGFVGGLYGLLRFKSDQTSPGRRWSWLLLGLVLGQTVQIVIVAKYGVAIRPPRWRYLLPTVIFYPLNVLLLLEVGKLLWQQYKWWPKLQLLIACLALSLPALRLKATYSQARAATADRLEFTRTFEQTSAGHIRVFLQTASHPDFVLWYANEHAGRRYNELLRNIIGSNQPPTYVLNHDTGDLVSLYQPQSHLSSIATGPFVLAGGTRFQQKVISLLPTQAVAQKVFEKAGQVIYKVDVVAPVSNE